jgi:hypothetical protein
MPFTFKLSQRLARMKRAVTATGLPVRLVAAQTPICRALLPSASPTSYAVEATTGPYGPTRHAALVIPRSRKS